MTGEDELSPDEKFEKALERLRLFPDFHQVTEYVLGEREEMIGRFAGAINDGEAMKTAGAVAMADRIWGTLKGTINAT